MAGFEDELSTLLKQEIKAELGAGKKLETIGNEIDITFVKILNKTIKEYERTEVRKNLIKAIQEYSNVTGAEIPYELEKELSFFEEQQAAGQPTESFSALLKELLKI